MRPGQFAVHVSRQRGPQGVPCCWVCDGMGEAEAAAQARVASDPTLRCRIYDHQGFVGAPLREVQGAQFRGESDLTPRLRRWLGAVLLAVGVGLCALDWSTGFRLSWPALVGSRLLIPGFVLVVTEALLVLHARQKALQARDREVAG
jgi:hypothetical protein